MSEKRAPLLIPPEAPLQRRDRGYAALVVVIVSWVGQSELAQYIQVRLGYNKPFMVTWINHGAMALLLPILRMAQGGLKRRVLVETGASARRAIVVCSALGIFYTLGDYLWYVALPLTSVAEATALFNASPVFTYAFSVLLLRERVTIPKVTLMQ